MAVSHNEALASDDALNFLAGYCGAASFSDFNDSERCMRGPSVARARVAAFHRRAVGARMTQKQTTAVVPQAAHAGGSRQSFVRHGSAACRRRRSSAACKGNT
ncbi:hypothetical protein [Derxia gummosa]|uniref:Uncharacterized protein n=1 Tax=Derxia gummosa DSM 723 TaxID=1121388 RepID=A0A8B6XAN6_9BURK|nr:hypothetical protein [Derxia gummosa]